MNSINNKKIAIVGGGPGGLTLARLLQMNGADVKVYERDAHKDARMKGATLDLHDESGLAALEQAGLMDAFRANYRPGADKLKITDKQANIIFDDETQDTGETNRPEIDRGPLQYLLLESSQSGTVIWDSQFVSMTADVEGWELNFKSGSTAIAGLVIAADGANSKIRPYITPIKPFYSGITAVEGAVYQSAVASPKVHQLLNGGKIFAMGNEKTLIVSSKGDGSLVFYTSLNVSENWVTNRGVNFTDKRQVTDWFKNEYQGWDSSWLELFENAEAAFTPRPLYCMPLDQSWQSLPNLTMLGDAAHLMPPFAGEGVNMAMLDALELSRCLLDDQFTDLHAAITAYVTNMLKRSSIMAGETMNATAALHSPDAITYMINVIR